MKKKFFINGCFRNVDSSKYFWGRKDNNFRTNSCKCLIFWNFFTKNGKKYTNNYKKRN